MTEIIPLESLTDNQLARVVDIDGPSAWKHRLAEIGVRDGAEIRLVKRGNPCILAIGEQRLSFRPDPGVLLLVQAIP